MNDMDVSEAELHAWLDGELPDERRAAVEAYLAERPEEAARLADYREQNEALRRLFQPALHEALPERLIGAAGGPAAKRRSSWSERLNGPWLRLAAAVFLVLFGGLLGWFGHARQGDGAGAELARLAPLPRQAAVAHVVYAPDARRPVEVAAEQEEQLVKWLSKRLGTAVRVPQLGGLGYALVGGRLLPGNSGPVAQFMYQTAAGERLTLYVSSEYAGNRETGFRFAREGDLNVFYWIDGKFGYALSGGVARRDLAQAASAVYQQLELP